MIYGNIIDWRSYALARGDNAPTAASDPDATASLQRASDYIRTRYVIRLGLADDDANVIEATYIAAGYDLATPNFWATTFTPAQAKVLTKVDAIQWTVIDGGASGMDAQLPTSPAIDALFLGKRAYGFGGFVV
tara:strand:- start:14402 stop:14800 length:399 start_codon:yes stop_codon:yes gene_type:complete